MCHELFYVVVVVAVAVVVAVSGGGGITSACRVPGRVGPCWFCTICLPFYFMHSIENMCDSGKLQTVDVNRLAKALSRNEVIVSKLQKARSPASSPALICPNMNMFCCLSCLTKGSMLHRIGCSGKPVIMLTHIVHTWF